MHPRTAGPYTLLRPLGPGRVGELHLGRTDKGARLVITIIRPEFARDPAFLACLREDLDLAYRVRSPRVAAVLDGDLQAEVPWLATEYVEAPTLRAVVAEGGPLSPDDQQLLGVGLAEALEAIHAAGTAHRDLTPDAVVLAPDGPHLTDLGIARALAASPLTRGSALLGTPGYVAPEQIVEGVGRPASDVFALGAVLLHAATARSPFGSGDPVAVLDRALHSWPVLDGVPPGFAPVVEACLNRDPAARPGPQQVRDALTAIDLRPTGYPEAIQARPTVVARRAGRPRRSALRLAASVIQMAVVVTLLLAVLHGPAWVEGVVQSIQAALGRV
jgi:serine/threonine protein kinase